MSFLRHHRRLWKHGAFLQSAVIGTLCLVIGLACMIAARSYLLHEHPVPSPDLFLDILPSMRLENFLAWGIPILLALMAFIVFLYPEHLPFTLKSIGLLFLIRSFFVVLTPLGIRPDQAVTIPIGFLQQLAYSNDFFFSGHVSLPFMFALIFWREQWIRSLMLGISALFAVCVLLAHTHYSIDVFSVPFIVPSIYRLALLLFKDDRAPFAVSAEYDA